MIADLDTLLTALYVELTDRIIPALGLGRRGPGKPPEVTDAELVCLAVAQVLLGARSEHHWLRLCYGRLGHLFPYLPKQPGYHKRLKAAAPLICQRCGPAYTGSTRESATGCAAAYVGMIVPLRGGALRSMC